MLSMCITGLHAGACLLACAVVPAINNPFCPCSCTLFGKNLFTTAAKLSPFFDSEIVLTKCFLPEPRAPPPTLAASIEVESVPTQACAACYLSLPCACFLLPG